MDVLIVERDGLVAEVIADALAGGGIVSFILHDEADAFAIPQDEAPQVVITGMNRRGEDLNGLAVARRLRSRWPALAVVYMAALWPVRLQRHALSFRERFLAKPVHIAKLIATVREQRCRKFEHWRLSLAAVVGDQGDIEERQYEKERLAAHRRLWFSLSAVGGGSRPHLSLRRQRAPQRLFQQFDQTDWNGTRPPRIDGNRSGPVHCPKWMSRPCAAGRLLSVAWPRSSPTSRWTTACWIWPPHTKIRQRRSRRPGNDRATLWFWLSRQPSSVQRAFVATHRCGDTGALDRRCLPGSISAPVEAAVVLPDFNAAGLSRVRCAVAVSGLDRLRQSGGRDVHAAHDPSGVVQAIVAKLGHHQTPFQIGAVAVLSAAVIVLTPARRDM